MPKKVKGRRVAKGDDNEGGTSLGVDHTNLFGEDVRSEIEQGRDGAIIDGDAGVKGLAVEGAATVSVWASSFHSMSSGEGKKAGAPVSVGGREREPKY